MWSIKYASSDDSDDFVSFIKPSGSRILVTGRGNFFAEMTSIEIGRLCAERGSERLARVLHMTPTRTGLIFLTEPGAELFCNGAKIQYSQVALCRSGEPYILRLTGPASYGAMTMADDDLAAIQAQNPHSVSLPMDGLTVITPPAEVMARLYELHAYAGSSVALSNYTDSAPILEQGLIAVLMEIINQSNIRTDTVARQHHHLIICRFMDMLGPLAVRQNDMQEISDAIGISSRTLRVACQEQLGVSPTQYLLLRRMHLARRALQQADPDIARVTDVATVFGFWELGRFAVRYREIFGETPSSTLRAFGPASRRPMVTESLEFA